MLHQIVRGCHIAVVVNHVLFYSFLSLLKRKMIGLLVLVVRTGTPVSLIPETFGPRKIHVPKAPALGLLLERPVFTGYNKKVTVANASIAEREAAGKNPQEELREQIDDSAIRAAVDAFKKERVYTSMWEEEARENTCVPSIIIGFVLPDVDFGLYCRYAGWLNFLDVHAGHDFEYVFFVLLLLFRLLY
jgi:tRNA pseudouridine38-40 synthase